MERRHRQNATWGVALVLVFGIGILVGRQFCVEAPPPPPEPDCPPPNVAAPPVFEFCPPPADEEPPEEPEEPTREQPATEELPESPPPVDPQNRRELLGWARDQSTTLEGCPRDRGETHRLGISLEIEENAVAGVSINTEGEDLPPEFESCLRRRITEWTLPEQLSAPGRELFFHLRL